MGRFITFKTANGTIRTKMGATRFTTGAEILYKLKMERKIVDLLRKSSFSKSIY
jgi:hypothetical protein